MTEAVDQPDLVAFMPGMGDLSPMQATVYKRCDWNGEKPEEIALDVGLKATTVRTHLWRARGKLGTNPGGKPL